ncbi:MAG: DUF6503 family protein [Thermoanaerobaculia bacterium]
MDTVRQIRSLDLQPLGETREARSHARGVRRGTLLAAALLAAVGLAGPGAAQEGDGEDREVLPIVVQAIEHHGGDLYESTESSFEIASASGAFRVEVRRDGGLYRHVVEGETPDGLRRVTVTNDSVEVTVDGEPVRVQEDREQGWRNHVDARVWFPFLPYGLAGDGVYLHDRGLVEWPVEEGAGARELREVKVTFQPGSSSGAEDEYLFWFDLETGRMEQFAYSFAGGLRFRQAFDFRRVGGILFADNENYGVDGEGYRVDQVTPEFVAEEMELVSTIRLRDVEVEPVGDATPEGGAAGGEHPVDSSP